MDDAGILADPSDAGVLGIDALLDGACVNIAAGFDRDSMLACEILEGIFHLLETRQQRVMVIAAPPGVARNPTPTRVLRAGRVEFCGVVVESADYHGACPRRGMLEGRPAQLARRVALLHVLHFASVSGLNPFHKRRRLRPV